MSGEAPDDLGQRVLLDANLLLVLVLGLADRALIRRHKRTGAYTEEDFEFLVSLLAGRSILTTPHVLTEVSNLGCQGLSGRTLELFLATLKTVVTEHVEEHDVPARTAVDATIYRTLGLTDAAIERIASRNVSVLTADAPLWVRLQGLHLRAFNYNHVRPGLAGLR